MIEVAPDLWQCPQCGAGPKPEGSFSFWAMSHVQLGTKSAEALAVRYDRKLDIYVATGIGWELSDGFPVPGTVTEELVEYICTPAEEERHALPVILTGTAKLRKMMFDSALGPKSA